MSHTEALAAGAAAQPPSAGTSAGTVIGAAIGGAVFIVAAIALAIRLKVVSAQLNGPTVSAWNPGQKKKKVRVPDFDIALNPQVQMPQQQQQQQVNPAFSLRSLRVAQPVTTVPV